VSAELADFQHLAPPLRLYSGSDSLERLGRELERLGSERAVIFCGGTIARGQLLELVRAAMGERCAGVFAGVRAHSPRSHVEAAADALRWLEADAVLVVGGGSAVVTARAASIFLAEGYDLEKLSTREEGGRLRSPKLLAPKLPQLVLPTTPTTACVKAGTAVFDPATARRYALFDPKTRVQSLFIHPALIQSAPRTLVLSAGLDTLSLAIEGLTSSSGDPIADALLMHSVRLLSVNLAADDTVRARGELVMAAVLCGCGTDYTGAGIATVLGHAIGANHHVENGIAKAIVLPHALRFNEAVAQDGIAKVATALGGRAAGLVAVNEALARLMASTGSPERLRDVGLRREDLPRIAARGMTDWFLRSNPRPVRQASDLEHVLEEAW
jgi:alcohol dehydrogenase